MTWSFAVVAFYDVDQLINFLYYVSLAIGVLIVLSTAAWLAARLFDYFRDQSRERQADEDLSL
jgi:hypothetical protein